MSQLRILSPEIVIHVQQTVLNAQVLDVQSARMDIYWMIDHAISHARLLDMFLITKSVQPVIVPV